MTIVPRSRGSMWSRAALVPQTVPRYVTSVARLNSSASISLNGAKIVAIALLTQMSIGPRASSTAPAADLTASQSARSVGSTSARPPASSISFFAPSSPSRPRAISAIWAPSCANLRAIARPMPDDAPVITTTSPLAMPKAVPDDPSLRTPARQDGYAPIEDYAVVGNKRSAGLVALDGSIDWLCLPAFDSASVFGALLDPERGGRWTLQPSVPFEASRRYVEGTNVLETTFTTESGTVRVLDAMTRGATRPIDWDEFTRRVECIDGVVPMRWRVEPRFEFKGLEADAIEPEEHASVAQSGGSAFTFRSGKLALGLSVWDCGDPEVRDGGIEAERDLTKGQAALFVLASFDDRPIAYSAREAAERRIEDTLAFWEGWSSGVTYGGEWPEAVK